MRFLALTFQYSDKLTQEKQFLHCASTIVPLKLTGNFRVLWLISTNEDGDRDGEGFLYYAGFSTGTETDANPLIQMYGIGMEICPWDGDPSLKWVQ